jgi:protein-disulfide isomerase
MRRQRLLMAAFFISAAAGIAQPAMAADAGALKAEMPGDKALGDTAAPVTLIEYASLSCSHCAAFHYRVLPTLKKEYIDTGKLRYVFRDFPLNGASLFAALVTNCSAKQGGDEKYFKVLDEIIGQQSAWTQSGGARASLLLIATAKGVDGKQLSTCIDEDKALEEKIIAGRKDATEQLGIKKTPAFVVNGEVVEKMTTPEEARKVIDAALAKAKPQPSLNTENKGIKP